MPSETTVHCRYIGCSYSPVPTGTSQAPAPKHVQSLMLEPSWREAQKTPTSSWGRGSHAGWNDVLWYALAEPGQASLCKEEAPASTAMLAETPKSATSIVYGKDMLTRASCIRNFDACVLFVLLLCIITFQHTLSWQLMLLVVIKPMVPSFLNGHKVRVIPRGDGSCSVQQMPMKICVHLPPHPSGKTTGN